MPASIRDALRRQLAGKSAQEIVEALFAFLQDRGQANYDESVTQLEHAVQSAQLSHEQGDADQMVTAALFHDLGHLLIDEHEGREGFLQRDLNHEEVGAGFLTEYFPESVTEPIRLHVPAKRYLCTTDSDYYGTLSAASKRSFELQGGKLSPSEQTEFERTPHLESALALRRLDDLAKVVGKSTPPVEHFMDAVLRCLDAQSRRDVGS